MGKLVMGYWDCPYCGTQGIQGTVVNCPSCGRARGEVQFYMKDHTEGESREQGQTGDIEYLSEEQARYVSKNPDWYCSFCNSLNSDNAQFCSNCGASRADSESNYFDMLKKKQERDAAETAAQPRPAAAAQPKSKRPMVFLLLVIALIVGLFMYMSGNKTDALKVEGISWARAVSIEEYRQLSESGWTLPDGAELTEQKNELHHFDSVLDHYETVEVQRSRRVIDHYETYYTYEDNGNGTFSQIEHERPVYETEYYTETEQQPVFVQVPRYQTKYYYTIWRWVPSREVNASGTDHNAAWPDPALGENEREGQKAEVYRFSVLDEKGQSRAVYRLAESDWRNLNPGDAIYITAQRTGANPYISTKDGEKIAEIIREN